MTFQQHILIVEEHDTTYKKECKLLSKMDLSHTPIQAKSVSEAIEAVFRCRPFAIFISLTSSNLKGQKALIELKRFARQIPKLLIINPDQEDDAFRLLSDGADDYINLNQSSGLEIKKALVMAYQRQKALYDLNSSTNTIQHLNHDLETHLNDHHQELNGTIDNLRNQLTIRNQILSEFTSALKSPLATISGGLQLVKETHLDAKQFDMINLLQNASSQMTTFFGKLSELASVYSKSLQEQNGSFSLGEVVYPLLDYTKSQVQHNGLNFISVFAEHYNSQLYKGDPETVSKMIKPLLDDAINHAQDGDIQFSTSINHQEGYDDVTFKISYISEQNDPIDEQKKDMKLALSKFIAQSLGGDISFKEDPELGTVIESKICLAC